MIIGFGNHKVIGTGIFVGQVSLRLIKRTELPIALVFILTSMFRIWPDFLMEGWVDIWMNKGNVRWEHTNGLAQFDANLPIIIL